MRRQRASLAPVSRRLSAGRSDSSLVVGLVNNMPRAAAETTEWQFRTLLKAAAGSRPVELRCFVLPEQRGLSALGCSRDHSDDLEAIWDSQLDGLIVTGTEPRAAAMTDEPTWPLLADLVDWAADHTTSTIWSCLAAHAAVLRLDGLARQPYPAKMSGLFDCVRTFEHPVLSLLPPHWTTPHSRGNTIDEDSLLDHGYRVLSQVPGRGPDCFIRQAGRSLFVMMQGHPEYDSGCLLREYRRDVKRHGAGRGTAFPAVPVNYVDALTHAALQRLQAQAPHRSAADLLANLDAIIASARLQTWQASAVQLYAGWLCHLAAEKAAFSSRRAARPLVHS